MRIRTGVVIAVALLLAPAAVSTQQRPNFSGRWVQLTPAEGAGEEQMVKHTDKLLILNHDSSGGGHELIYNLDGKQNRSTMASHGSEIVTVYTAAWKGNRLSIVSSSTYPDGRKLEQSQTWSLDDKNELVIEATQTMTGRPTEKRTIVHKKAQ